LIDLAEFYEAQGRHSDSDEMFRRASKIAPEAPVVWFEQAKTYIRSRRNIAAAKTLLQRFVEARLTPADPPLYEAKRLLGDLQSIR
jgi:predicted Zn-dependent protease